MLRQRQKNRDAFHRARIHHADEAIVEAAQLRMAAGIEQRDRHMDGFHAAPSARVPGHVFAHGHHAIGLPQRFGLELAG